MHEYEEIFYIKIFISAICLAPFMKNQKQSICLPLRKWINKWWFIHVVNFHAATKIIRSISTDIEYNIYIISSEKKQSWKSMYIIWSIFLKTSIGRDVEGYTPNCQQWYLWRVEFMVSKEELFIYCLTFIIYSIFINKKSKNGWNKFVNVP